VFSLSVGCDYPPSSSFLDVLEISVYLVIIEETSLNSKVGSTIFFFFLDVFIILFKVFLFTKLDILSVSFIVFLLID
jgi:hypothetical protein